MHLTPKICFDRCEPLKIIRQNTPPVHRIVNNKISVSIFFTDNVYGIFSLSHASFEEEKYFAMVFTISFFTPILAIHLHFFW